MSLRSKFLKTLGPSAVQSNGDERFGVELSARRKVETMKTMTCKELGGICDHEMTASSWDDMVKLMVKHVMENHPELANEMEAMHNRDPHAWGNEMKPKWDAAPEISVTVS
jgi:predicted small metal-binding protein